MSPESENQSKPTKLRLSVLALLVIGGLTTWQILSQHRPLLQGLQTTQPGLYQVSHIDDGDTIVVNQAGQTETVRLIGIDTPEVKDPRKPVQCYGREASNATKTLLTGQRVRLQPDPIGDNRDKYHRLLRYVYLPDGRFVNELLVQQGFAFAYTIFPFEKLTQFQQDEAQAAAQKLGLWSHCQVDRSSDIKQTNPVP